MKNNTRKAYLTILLAIAVLPMTMVVCYKQCSGKPIKQIPFSYDKNYVEPLNGFTGYNNLEELKEIGKIRDPQVAFLECWEDEGGDFRRIRIKLKNKKVVEYDNRDGWLEIFKKAKYGSGAIADFLKTPANSSKIKMHPYGITLDMGKGDQILMLFGYQYATDPARLLTLIYIGKDQAEIIFNTYFTLFEIRENQGGYSLIGKRSSDGSYADPYEIAIKNGKLTFEKLSLQKVYEAQDPHIVLYDAIGWGYDKQSGEFNKMEIIEPIDTAYTKDQVVNIPFYGAWSPISKQIKLPNQSATIKKNTYYIILNSRLILLSTRDYENSFPSILGIYCILPLYPISLYNNYFSLQEILEDDTAYHLLGTRSNTEDPNKLYEITIDKSTMSPKLNW